MIKKVRKYIFIAVICCVILLGIIIFSNKSESEVNDNIVGVINEADVREDSKNIIYNDDDYNITLYDIKWYYANASEDAECVDKVLENEELKVMANNAGFVANDADFNDYVNEIKEVMNNPDTIGTSQVKELYESFGGEENYWKMAKPVLIKLLSIGDYLEYCREEYAKELGVNANDNEFINNEWHDKEAEIRNEALSNAKRKIGKENIDKIFKIVKENCAHE